MNRDDESRAYYDAFSLHYDDERGGRRRGGYHDLLDDLEVDLVERWARGKELLEVGCGTGLLLERFAAFTARARGVDLSPGMLSHARARGLDVREGSATDLPFADASFDVVCSFKVLAHVEEIDRAIAEMFRVTRPGGLVIAELYNRASLRAVAKQIAGARAIAEGKDESSVYVRLDSVEEMRARFPRDAELVAERGIRIVTPAALVLRIPVVKALVRRAEIALAATPLKRFGGFYALVYRKAHAA
ncbi:MAG: class I SAM-dependent methyltransferase [Polyangiaceae bacterium]